MPFFFIKKTQLFLSLNNWVHFFILYLLKMLCKLDMLHKHLS